MENEMNSEFAASLEKANAGDIAAMIKVGNALRNGNKRMAVARDFDQGVSWLEKAANAGSVDAMGDLATAYRSLIFNRSYVNGGWLEREEYWRKKYAEAKASVGSVSGAVLIGKGRKQLRKWEFANNPELVDVVVAEGIETIKECSFRDCPNLRSVVLPKSLRILDWAAFSGCGNLSMVQIPEGVVEIGRFAFDECKELKEITLPDSLMKIGTNVFAGCVSLRKLVLGTGLSRIEDAAFRECSALRSVVFPANIKVIADNAFAVCTSLESISISGECEIRSESFAECTALAEIMISGNVTRIGFRAFHDCVALHKVEFPEGLKVIERSAFEGCIGLSSVNLPRTVTHVGSACFSNCRSLTHFEAAPANYHGCFHGCTSLPTLIIDGMLIYYARRGKEVIVPDGVTKLGCSVFAGDTEMESVVLPISLEKIGEEAFSNCCNLGRIELPENVREIESYAFMGCEKLSVVRLPAKLEKIKVSTFKDCRNLSTVYVDGQSPITGECVLPPRMTACEGRSFENCAFNAVQFSEGIEHLGRWAFAKCSNLTEITLPRTLKDMSCWIFKDCKKLRRVEFSYGAMKGFGEIDPAVDSREADGFRVCADICTGCTLEAVVVPDYLEARLSWIFGEAIPTDVKIASGEGGLRPWVRESPKDHSFFVEYGVHRYEIKYSYEPACDFYAGCRIKSPANESRSVVVPAKYKDGDTRELAAKISAKGASKTYSISAGDDVLEWHSLQRDAKKSKFWPVFAALAAYKPDAKK